MYRHVRSYILIRYDFEACQSDFVSSLLDGLSGPTLGDGAVWKGMQEAASRSDAYLFPGRDTRSRSYQTCVRAGMHSLYIRTSSRSDTVRSLHRDESGIQKFLPIETAINSSERFLEALLSS